MCNQPKCQILCHKKSPPKDFIRYTLSLLLLHTLLALDGCHSSSSSSSSPTSSATGNWSWICRLSRIYIMRSIILRIAQYAVIFPNCSRIKKRKEEEEREKEPTKTEMHTCSWAKGTVSLRIREKSTSGNSFCLNVSTTPITAMGCRQCLTLSVQLKGKHCRKPHSIKVY